MLDPKMAAEIEQGVAAIRELFPPVWRALSQECLKEGFTEAEAMDLVKTYILSQAPNGVNGQ